MKVTVALRPRLTRRALIANNSSWCSVMEQIMNWKTCLKNTTRKNRFAKLIKTYIYWYGKIFTVNPQIYRMYELFSIILQVRVFAYPVGPPAESTTALHRMACNNKGTQKWIVWSLLRWLWCSVNNSDSNSV